MTPVVLLVGLAIAIGVAGTLVPILPGLWLVWAACLVYGLIEGFSGLGWPAMSLITILAVLGTAAGLVLPQRSASGAGVPARWQVLAAVLAVVLFFVIPIVGAVIGFVVGIALGAFMETRDLAGTWSVTVATRLGVAVGAGIQLLASLLMAFVWALWVVLE